MNKRTIIIITAIAVPVVALIALTKPASMHKVSPAGVNATANQSPPPATLEEAREHTKKRLAELEKMTPADWPAQLKENPHRPPTLEEAIKRNKARLARLEAMTPQEWNAQRHRAATAQNNTNLSAFARERFKNQTPAPATPVNNAAPAATMPTQP